MAQRFENFYSRLQGLTTRQFIERIDQFCRITILVVKMVFFLKSPNRHQLLHENLSAITLKKLPNLVTLIVAQLEERWLVLPTEI